MTRFVRGIAVAAMALGLLVGGARPASAHATLDETRPSRDAVVETSPAAVELGFTEPVDPGLGGVKVIAPSGDRVDRGRVERSAGGRRLRVPINARGEGTYTVAWKVVSDDSHTISGSFVFSVGRVTGAAASVSSARTGVDALSAVGRWAAFAGTIVAVGGMAFASLVAPAGGATFPRRRLTRLSLVGAALAVAGGLVGLLTQVSLASGRPLFSSLGLLADAATNTRFGALSFIRLCLAGVALLVLAMPRVSTRRLGAATLWLAAAGLLAVPALAGHAWTVQPRWLAVPVDIVHLAAAAVWIGGLAALAAVAPGRDIAGALTRRFSAVALVAVGVVVATGSVSGYLQVRSVDAATGTDYGKLLIVKVAAVAVLVALGWLNRRRLASLLPSGTTVTRLLRVVRAEVAVGLVIVVGLTAALVNRPPARTDLVRPFAATVALADDPTGGTLQIEVRPARPGRNDVHMYFFTAQGLPRSVDAVELTVGRNGVPARPVKVTPVTADHVSAYGVTLPSPGRWRLNITAVRQTTQFTASVEVEVR